MKIKFPDTGQIIEVTEHSQLANTKVRVTPETSRQIQEAAFKLGYERGGGGKKVDNTYAKYLFFRHKKYFQITLSHDYMVFAGNTAREFEFISPLEEPQPSAGQEDTTTIPTSEFSILLKQLAYATDALKDIRDWNEDMEDAWDDPGDRARQALKAIDRATLPPAPKNVNS